MVVVGGLLRGVLESLPGCYNSLGWVQLVMGSYVWREIAFGVPSPQPLPEGSICTNDCHIKTEPIVGVGPGSSMVIGRYSLSCLVLCLWTAAPLWRGVLL